MSIDTAINNVRRTREDAVRSELDRIAYLAALDDLVIEAQLLREKERKA